MTKETRIAMLVGLLTPAVIAARETARRAQCANNLKELGSALIQFDLAKQRFPGYANRVPGHNDASGNSIPVSWAVMILPNIQRKDIWDQYRDPNASPQAVEIGMFACPSDHDKSQYQQSYVANCGLQDNNLTSRTANCPDWPANGVFLNLPTTNGRHVTASRIADGTQHTILLSENIQAHQWDLDTNATASFEEQVGMIWHNDQPNLPDPPAEARINKGIEDATDISYEHARPSSNHPGGVNVVFCSGHVQFLREDIDYDVYARLMSSDGKNSMVAGSSEKVGLDTKQTTPLGADDYID